jgi:TolB protein
MQIEQMQMLITILVAAMASQNPAVSPDGKRIAFIADHDIFVIAADGTNAVRVTHTPEEEGRPEWSPDGKLIRFSVYEKDASRIYTVDPRSKDVRQIGSVPGRASGVSPDGKRTLYWTGGWTAVKMFNAALDGSDARAISDGTGVMWCSRWSPDGKRIAFTGRDSTGELNVYVMDADGSGVKQLTTVPGAQCPAWSRDGKRLAFQVTEKMKRGHVETLDLATGAVTKLAPHENAVEDELPFWFPDGKHIAFQSNRTGEMQIWIMNADGTGLVQITR